MNSRPRTATSIRYRDRHVPVHEVVSGRAVHHVRLRASLHRTPLASPTVNRDARAENSAPPDLTFFPAAETARGSNPVRIRPPGRFPLPSAFRAAGGQPHYGEARGSHEQHGAVVACSLRVLSRRVLQGFRCFLFPHPSSLGRRGPGKCPDHGLLQRALGCAGQPQGDQEG